MQQSKTHTKRPAHGSRARLAGLIIPMALVCAGFQSCVGVGHAAPAPRDAATPRPAPIAMSGRQFVATWGAGGEARLVRVQRFAGERLEASLWRADSGWTERALHARALVGAHWLETRCDRGACRRRVYRVVAAHRDTAKNTMPEHSDNSDVWLYDVEYADADADADEERDWRPACAADARGVARGLFITGAWHRDGTRTDSGYTFSCTAGVIAKCVRNWGYKPWKHLPTARGRSVSLQPLHHACTRAVRADYCGDGVAHTRNGTPVDIFDRFGFNVRDSTTSFSPEAGFSAAGATWVARTRWPIGARTERAHTHLPGCSRPRPPGHQRASGTLLQVHSQ